MFWQGALSRKVITARVDKLRIETKGGGRGGGGVKDMLTPTIIVRCFDRTVLSYSAAHALYEGHRLH